MKITKFVLDDRSMLLKMLQSKTTPMSAKEIMNYWSPTWTLERIQTMLNDLLEQGYVKSTGVFRIAYFAVNPLGQAGAYYFDNSQGNYNCTVIGRTIDGMRYSNNVTKLF